ncbi:MAG: heme A synthase [Gammaproteobacteria bacterium]|nr:heme A synthase [Gammaproteobacteria bacterium]
MTRTRFVLFAVMLASVVVILGAWTRLSDAGLGCPDWPGCYGFLHVPTSDEHVAIAEERFPHAPYEEHKAWPEMIHRYFASTLGLVILGLAVAFVRARKRTAAESPPPPLKLPLALFALVCLQGAFGAWTVTLKLWPQVVTAHLLGGFSTLALLWLLYLRQTAGFGGRWFVPGVLLKPGILIMGLVVLQIALGGWVSSNYAALACPDFPTCHGELVPPLDFKEGFDVMQSVGPNYLGGQLESDARVTIQVMHRLGALLVLLSGGWLAWRLHKAGSLFGPALAAVLGLQILLGILNVVLMLPLSIATLHNAGGALVLLTLVTVNFRAFRNRPLT